MKLSPVDSTAVEGVGYDAERRWLEVRWKGQEQVYRYYAVPAEIYDELLRAESIGAYVNERVKPRYLHELVDASP
jgi:hypothetical protein